MKVGDLVKCPPCDWNGGQEGYVGLILGVYGHKVEILGGPQGKETWDSCDIRLV